MYILKKSDVLAIAEELKKEFDIYGPVKDRDTGQTLFVRTEINEIDLTAPVPSIPPKHLVFPQFEAIISYRYDRQKKEVSQKPGFDDSPKALFGLRSCDLVGLQCLDRFLLGQEYIDEFYRHHRKGMFIVTNTCVAPFKQCFCVCTDSGPSARDGYDLNLTDIGEYYFVEAGSARGTDIALRLSLKDADSKHLKEKEIKVNESVALFDHIALDSKAWVSRVVNRVTTGLIDEKVWEFIGDQCFECGACSFVCPTCSCFNIADSSGEDDSAERLRTWDSCSYEGYSRMAGGHNPRKPVEDRRNKRFFCKLSYSQSKKYLRPGCVGCGRCAWVCPGDIGLPNVVTYLRRDIHK